MLIDEQQLREIERFFHQKIPLTRAIGIRVESYDRKELVLTAPLAPNHNHLGTAFGGSLSAIATLAGYGLLWLELNDRTSHVVISESSILFRRPVRSDIIRAICRRPDESAVTAFKAELAQKGKGRIRLTVTIEGEHQVAVQFEGTFVAIK